MKKLWFEEGHPDRRNPQNRLRRIAHENDQEEEGRIQKWLDLAKKIFDGDDDPSTSAA